MKTIALAAAKGGVGKTTLAAALATAAFVDPKAHRVGLIDLDPQGSLTQWWNIRAEPQPMLLDLSGRPLKEVRRQLRGRGIDLLVLDCPPGFSPILQAAIASAIPLAVCRGE